jgi:hypothetical protein
MVTTELTPLRPHLAAAGVLVAGLTALGATLAFAWPRLGGSVAPHTALDASAADALAILANNARALTAPFALLLLGLGRRRCGRRIANLIVVAVAAVNAIPVGVALGRWQGRLIPYIPQLPIEWAALTTAVATWRQGRAGGLTPRRVAALAGVTLALLAAAAAVETWCTPHRHATRHHRSAPNTSDPSCDLTACGRSGGLTVATDCAPGAAGSLQGRALPSPRHVRFRSAAIPALLGLTSTHRPPQGGIT